MNNNFALIIGAMKCGTTSLFYYLSEHPQIAAAKNKEPQFFSYDHNLAKGMAWYQSIWDWQPENHIALEASTTYTMQPKYANVAERIAQVKDAKFRFIYIMRHPFARIESHMRHLLFGGHQEIPEIIEEHLAFSEYARQLDTYVNTFGRERLHLLLLEDLQNDPKTQLRRICEFLDIDSDYEFKSIDVVLNSNNTLNLHPVLRQLYQIPAVKSLGSLMPPQLRQKLYKPLSRQTSYDIQLSEQNKELILKRLQPDLTRLEAEYGIDVQGKWGLIANQS